MYVESAAERKLAASQGCAEVAGRTMHVVAAWGRSAIHADLLCPWTALRCTEKHGAPCLGHFIQRNVTITLCPKRQHFVDFGPKPMDLQSCGTCSSDATNAMPKAMLTERCTHSSDVQVRAKCVCSMSTNGSQCQRVQLARGLLSCSRRCYGNQFGSQRV